MWFWSFPGVDQSNWWRWLPTSAPRKRISTYSFSYVAIQLINYNLFNNLFTIKISVFLFLSGFLKPSGTETVKFSCLSCWECVEAYPYTIETKYWVLSVMSAVMHQEKNSLTSSIFQFYFSFILLENSNLGNGFRIAIRIRKSWKIKGNFFFWKIKGFR